jgi:hypothetical protein
MALAALLAIAIVAVVAHRAPAGAGLITDDVIAASAASARRDARSACAAIGTLTTGSA